MPKYNLVNYVAWQMGPPGSEVALTIYLARGGRRPHPAAPVSGLVRSGRHLQSLSLSAGLVRDCHCSFL